MTTSTEYSLIVPIFNGIHYLPLFWDSISATQLRGSEIIVINDGSTEDVISTIPSFHDDISLQIINHDKSHGYAHSVNTALDIATGNHLLLLNSDIMLMPNTILSISRCLSQEPRIGILGAKLLYPQTGRIQHFGLCFSETRKLHVFTHGSPSSSLVSTLRDVQAVTFALCCIPRHIYEKFGPLNASYRNGSEDIDYSLRVRKGGYRVLVDPEVTAYHWEGQSGEERHAYTAANEARFWRDWGSSIVADIGSYIAESWDSFRETEGVPAGTRYTIVNLSKGRDDELILEFLDSRGVCAEVWDLRQSRPSGYYRWLSMILPIDSFRHRRPFIFIVDEFPQLAQNSYWLSLRRPLGGRDLIMDHYANVLRADEAALSPGPFRLKNMLDVS